MPCVFHRHAGANSHSTLTCNRDCEPFWFVSAKIHRIFSELLNEVTQLKWITSLKIMKQKHREYTSLVKNLKFALQQSCKNMDKKDPIDLHPKAMFSSLQCDCI